MICPGKRYSHSVHMEEAEQHKVWIISANYVPMLKYCCLWQSNCKLSEWSEKMAVRSRIFCRIKLRPFNSFNTEMKYPLLSALFHPLFQRFADRPVVEIREYEIVFLTGSVTLDNLQRSIQQFHLERHFCLVRLDNIHFSPFTSTMLLLVSSLMSTKERAVKLAKTKMSRI